ncbi:MAG: hypothetical protein RL385_2371 [Pseudomonadota bacterium]
MSNAPAVRSSRLWQRAFLVTGLLSALLLAGLGGVDTGRRVDAQTKPAMPAHHLSNKRRVAEGAPHPISHEHVRQFRDVDLLRAADAALGAGQIEEARAILASHHLEMPALSQVEEEALWLLADCVEDPSADRVARVQQFYDDHPASTLRRRLRRLCLEAG